jgi:hypothetical protein
MSHPIYAHRRCDLIGAMVWSPDGDECACRRCGTTWTLSAHGWKPDGLQSKPTWVKKRPTKRR